MTRTRRFWLKLLLLAMLVPGTGCTRKFFRDRADCDVDKLLSEKNVFEPWKIEQFHVYPDPRARFADPTDPDHPPLPPDDPAAQALSPNPQRPGKAGVGLFTGTGYLEILAGWDAMNRANNPPELKPVPEGDKTKTSATNSPPCDPTPRTYLINLEQACELGLFNSRDFQDQRENLYLSALPVSLQRFSFAAQLFALGNASFQNGGADTAVPGQRWTGSGSYGLTKVFPTGATLLAQLANQFAFDLTNGTPNISVSTLSLALTQPLLQGGGRAVTLEPLTQAERNMLYAIRSYARFRKQFYVSVAGGGGTGGTNAALLDPSLGALATSLSPGTGYLPTVRQAANLEVNKQNVLTLQDFLKRFEAFREGGAVSQVNVDQIRQQLLSAQSQVLSNEVQLRNALDTFKIQLGLPPSLELELDSAPIRPMAQQLARYQEALDQFRGVLDTIDAKYASPDEAAQLRGRLKLVKTESDLVKGTTFRGRILKEWKSWEDLNDDQLRQRLSQLAEERRKALDEKTRIESKNQDAPAELLNRIARIESDIRLGILEQSLRAYEKQPWKAIGDPVLATRRQKSLFNTVTDAFERILTDARTERFDQIGNSWPALPPITVGGVDVLGVPLEVAYSKASQTAMTNRLDLMNARGELVDRWRQIAVRANSLLGVLDVGYSLDSNTPPGAAQPFNFSTGRTTQRLTFNGELPLVRRVERNAYRTALINYQRERRSLQQTEDQILNGVRNQVRQLRVLAENYKINQQRVLIAYRNVENSLELFYQPDQPTAGTGPPAPGGGNAVANTQQLLTAQSQLNNAQQQIFSIWIDFQTQRMALFRDLEILPLDARGVWIDEQNRQPDAQRRSDNYLPNEINSTETRSGEVLPASWVRQPKRPAAPQR